MKLVMVIDGVVEDANLPFHARTARRANQRVDKAADYDVAQSHPCKSGVAQQRRASTTQTGTLTT